MNSAETSSAARETRRTRRNREMAARRGGTQTALHPDHVAEAENDRLLHGVATTILGSHQPLYRELGAMLFHVLWQKPAPVVEPLSPRSGAAADAAALDAYRSFAVRTGRDPNVSNPQKAKIRGTVEYLEQNIRLLAGETNEASEVNATLRSVPGRAFAESAADDLFAAFRHARAASVRASAGNSPDFETVFGLANRAYEIRLDGLDQRRRVQVSLVRDQSFRDLGALRRREFEARGWPKVSLPARVAERKFVAARLDFARNPSFAKWNGQQEALRENERPESTDERLGDCYMQMDPTSSAIGATFARMLEAEGLAHQHSTSLQQEELAERLARASLEGPSTSRAVARDPSEGRAAGRSESDTDDEELTDADRALVAKADAALQSKYAPIRHEGRTAHAIRRRIPWARLLDMNVKVNDGKRDVAEYDLEFPNAYGELTTGRDRKTDQVIKRVFSLNGVNPERKPVILHAAEYHPDEERKIWSAIAERKRAGEAATPFFLTRTDDELDDVLFALHHKGARVS